MAIRTTFPGRCGAALGRSCSVQQTNVFQTRVPARSRALGEHIVQVGGRGLGEGLESKVVQHQQIRSDGGCQPLVPGPVPPPAVDMLKHLVGVDKEHIKALATRFVRQGLGKDRLLDGKKPLPARWETSSWLRAPLIVHVGGRFWGRA
jgi:hypothetical protein